MSLSATDLSTTTPCPRMQPPTTRAIRRQVVHGEVRRVASGATTGCSPTANCAVVETASLRFTGRSCRVVSELPPPWSMPGPPVFRVLIHTTRFHSIIRKSLCPFSTSGIPNFQKKLGAVPIRCSQFLPLTARHHNTLQRHVQRANSAAHHEKCVSTRAQKIHHDQDQRPKARRTRTRTDGKPPTPDDRTGLPTNQADR